MTTERDGLVNVDAREVLAALAKAEHNALGNDTVEPERSTDYRAGAADAYADAQTLVRKMAGLPVAADSERV
ncbi:hypothetical protein [Amycolatopsis sp. 195334CR]|uniref:hypothetical protein n=1 Tax=Amycolatopsis sp. 195334CR TaxID=2814588 RepID=UPI001A8ED6C8|nr:hypothetical protein [Amycolatopsis sp. 195334CR]MBN6034098.1 hypothetical protein [Amycolatopsis sp. 195334CR]